ncbi:DUF4360 domain-containing protein [Pseudonocardiaceae bacterium YIM PH 21723]|nr:DUF4360 domain-containing protein [Pseudonocardiaceae bacterium YIM PH 21723]
MLNMLTAAGLAASLLFPTGWGAGNPPPPDKIVVDLVTVNGTGCPAGTAAVAVSDDNQSFTVTYSAFTAMSGVGSKPTDMRKNCQLNLKVHVPNGFTYAIASTDYRGFGHLEPGSSAVHRANYYFQGMSQTQYSTHNIAAPLDDNWQVTDQVDIASLVFKPCGEERNFNINAELRVAQGTAPATSTNFISMDSTDGNFQTIYHMALQKCPAPKPGKA